MQRVEMLCGTYRSILDRNKEFIGSGEINRIGIIQEIIIVPYIFSMKLRKFSKIFLQTVVQRFHRNFHVRLTCKKKKNLMLNPKYDNPYNLLET